MNFKKHPSTNFRPVNELGKEAAAEEIQALREGLRYHDHLYYVDNQPEISDAVYDRLFHRLEELEETFPDLKSDDSPTVRVGAEPVGKLKKVRHTAPMLSLQAVGEEQEVKAFDRHIRQHAKGKAVDFVLEPKFDGFSVELVYQGGRFDRGVTRGNGEVGEDISYNLRTIGAVPLVLQESAKPPTMLAVRGEVFMRRQGFLTLNRERVERNEEPFANPRNAAAGLMRQLDSRKVAGKPLDIFFYELLAADDAVPRSHHEVLARFAEWGLKTSPLNKKASSLAEFEQYHHQLEAERDDLDYEIDGVIIKVDDHGFREQLGVRARSPRWALAWKFAPREEVTTLEDITVQVGRTGMLTPVALLQPVDVGGVTVSRATLHNEDELRRKDVRPGDRVRIVRAGDVIPEVKDRIPQSGRKRAQPFSMPPRCPVCGAPVVREGAYYFCPAGLSCSAQLVGRVVHYGSRNAMNIDHLGEKTVRQLVARGFIHDLADLYWLSVADLKSLEGFAEKSASQLFEAIQGAKEARLDRFLYALGIRHVGRRMARVLASQAGSLKALEQARSESLQAIPEIGEEIARSVTDFFAREENRRVLHRLREAGVRVRDMPGGAAQRKLEGKTFVLTGTLEHFTRAEAKEHIEVLGGRASSSLSGETDYLVVGKNPGKKLAEAEEYGTQRLDEDEFRKMIEAH